MYLKFESFDDSPWFTPLSFRLADLELFSNVNHNTHRTNYIKYNGTQNSEIVKGTRIAQTKEGLRVANMLFSAYVYREVSGNHCAEYTYIYVRVCHIT